ncbi:PHP domain-containing protein [Haliovirga abyssi]|uniref:Histidinol-phosphatase n=1 Tax=Haliovirga abyssi TaxID=2996794 RepID=A0AAU9E2I4_9FUSO|nr:PHP domain-containing protein [Haliovirga abyssi]BDU50595.1 histidinol-phosphatase [Haliovirga abyssi]
MKFYADLHIHSVLSPCADLLMTTNNIIDKLIENDIKIFSITDHNSNKNSKVFKMRANEKGLIFIPGIEIETVEGIHTLGYFKCLEDLENVTKVIYNHLPKIKNREDIYGYQLILDKEDEYVEKAEEFLSGSVDLGIEDVVKLIKNNNGLAVPAHIDRSNSIISNLGYIPELKFDGIEIYMKKKIDVLVNKLDIKYPIFSSSDSHFVNTIEKAKMYFEFEKLDIDIDDIFKAINKGEINIVR